MSKKKNYLHDVCICCTEDTLELALKVQQRIIDINSCIAICNSNIQLSYDTESNELEYYYDEEARKRRLCNRAGSSSIYFLIVKGESLPLHLVETGMTIMTAYQGYDKIQTEEGISDIKGHLNFSSLSTYDSICYDMENRSLLAWFVDKESEDMGISLIDSIRGRHRGFIPYNSPILKTDPETKIARVLEGMVNGRYRIDDFNYYPEQNRFVCARCHRELDWRCFKEGIDYEIYCSDCITKANIRAITQTVIKWTGMGLFGLGALALIVVFIIDDEFGLFLLAALMCIGFVIATFLSLVDKVKEKKKKRKGDVNEKAQEPTS